MRLLLTSAGIKNASIEQALVSLLGKPIAESNALCIPTAGYGHPQGSPAGAWRFISGNATTPMCELGWKSLGVLELTALPSITRERWQEWVHEADALLVNGGDALYLAHWMTQSGLTDLLPSLRDTVWVGLSAGSMVMTPRIGATSWDGSTPTAAMTPPWASWTSPSSRTSIMSCFPRTPWPTPSDGRVKSPHLPTPSTTKQPFRSSTTP